MLRRHNHSVYVHIGIRIEKRQRRIKSLDYNMNRSAHPTLNGMKKENRIKKMYIKTRRKNHPNS